MGESYIYFSRHVRMSEKPNNWPIIQVSTYHCMSMIIIINFIPSPATILTLTTSVLLPKPNLDKINK